MVKSPLRNCASNGLLSGDRCFYCAYELKDGHGSLCPNGYPSQHAFKVAWWAGHQRGLSGKDPAVPSNYVGDQRDRYMMGWVQGTEIFSSPEVSL